MAQYKDIIIPNGSTFNNSVIKGNGNVSFKDTPQNQFDSGSRFAEKGTYKILSVVDRSKEDTAPFATAMNISGFSVKIGTIVNIQLIKNVRNSIPTEMIIMTGGDTANKINTPNTTDNKSIFTPKNIIIALVSIGIIIGGLKLAKVF